jgi:hypothetical protein
MGTHSRSQSPPTSANTSSAASRSLEELQPWGNQAALDSLRAGAASANGSVRGAAGSANTAVRDKASSAKATLRQKHEERSEDTPDTSPPTTTATFVDHDGNAPEMSHDHGFLDDGNGNIDESKRREATWEDYAALAKWTAMLEGAELLRPDLVDGTSAYRHFLTGGGATRTIDYQRFVEGDSSGGTVLASAMADARQAAIAKHDDMIAGRPPSAGTESFRMRTDPISVGNDGRYPYPATENWQKAIGAHRIWLEMDVTVNTVEEVSHPTGVAPGSAPVCTPEGDTAVTYRREFSVDMTLHMEDMYNFNPGAADIVTGAPDADNGRFEETGLGHEYLNVATLDRSFTFDTTMDPASGDATETPTQPDRAPRTGRPADRRPYPTTR